MQMHITYHWVYPDDEGQPVKYDGPLHHLTIAQRAKARPVITEGKVDNDVVISLAAALVRTFTP